MAALTESEKVRIKDMNDMLRNLESSSLLAWDFRTLNVELLPQNLRRLASDLYSVLDYVCNLIYCHYNNNGEPDYSGDSINVKIPYKDTLKSSDFPGQEDNFRRKREKFVHYFYNLFFGVPFGSTDEETQKRCNDFEKLILSLQRITKVDAAGNEIVDNTSTSWTPADCFNLLYFIRNQTSHRGLIRVVIRDALFNQTTGELEITNEARSTGVSPDLLVLDPSLFPEPTPLMMVTSKLIQFATITRNELIKMAFCSGNRLDYVGGLHIMRAEHVLNFLGGKAVCVGGEELIIRLGEVEVHMRCKGLVAIQLYEGVGHFWSEGEVLVRLGEVEVHFVGEGLVDIRPVEGTVDISYLEGIADIRLGKEVVEIKCTDFGRSVDIRLDKENVDIWPTYGGLDEGILLGIFDLLKSFGRPPIRLGVGCRRSTL